MANDGHAGEGVYNVNDAENNSYPGSSAYPNIENSDTMIQDQHQGLGPYGYSQSAWYPVPRVIYCICSQITRIPVHRLQPL